MGLQGLTMPFPVHSVCSAAALVVSAALCLCSIWCIWSSRTPSRFREKRLKILKAWRIVGYALLATSQGVLVWLGLHNLDQERAGAASVDQWCALALWAGIMVMLLASWPRQGSLQLFPTHLTTLLLVAVLLTMDIVALGGEHAVDANDITSISVHTSQLALVAALLIVDITALHGVVAPAADSGSLSHPLISRTTSGKPDVDEGGLPPHGETRMAMAMTAFRYVWPESAPMKARLWSCFVLVLLERVVNLCTPIFYKHMVDRMTTISLGQPLARHWHALMAAAASAGGGADGAAAVGLAAPGPGGSGTVAQELTALLSGLLGAGMKTSFWYAFYPWVFGYLAFYFLRGGSGVEGLLANVRDLLFIPITQGAYRRISMDVFEHLLDLDHNFHLHRKTGQIMRILDRGTSSIQDTVSIVLFNVLPQMIDIVTACVYLAWYTQPWTAVIVFVTVASYVPLTIFITERRGRIRKKMNALDNAREGRATDMLLNYETVKFFVNEKFELENYDEATREYQAQEYWQMAFVCVLSIVQSMVVWVGLAAGVVICTDGLVKGTQTVGDAILFITMMSQLCTPLAYFGSYYRQVQKALIDMENMFQLLQTVPKVQDTPGAKKLQSVAGKVEFDRVTFGYSVSHPVLRGVSFAVPGGKTLAVVGATGSGKSTILRLLLRFYDPQSGAVLIDNQNILHVKQKSVRSAIAVVPQDTVLFNDTVLYNIRYGRPAATDAEVYEAAEVAHIHQSITTSFKNGYSTRVGERGLRLSGGEKQRVAFARAVLKRPAILVLDEATSALDSLTEHQIQSSLLAMRARCTTIIVAHRLSTVVDADYILVLDHGQVAEFGSHSELIEQDGLYSAMWMRQQTDVDGCLINSRSRADLTSPGLLAAAKAQMQAAAPNGSGRPVSVSAASRALSPTPYRPSHMGGGTAGGTRADMSGTSKFAGAHGGHRDVLHRAMNGGHSSGAAGGGQDFGEATSCEASRNTTPMRRRASNNDPSVCDSPSTEDMAADEEERDGSAGEEGVRQTEEEGLSTPLLSATPDPHLKGLPPVAPRRH